MHNNPQNGIDQRKVGGLLENSAGHGLRAKARASLALTLVRLDRAAQGADHIRSDVACKTLLYADRLERLGPGGYPLHITAQTDAAIRENSLTVPSVGPLGNFGQSARPRKHPDADEKLEAMATPTRPMAVVQTSADGGTHVG
jgi:hypothetical protein